MVLPLRQLQAKPDAGELAEVEEDRDAGSKLVGRPGGRSARPAPRAAISPLHFLASPTRSETQRDTSS